MILVLALILGIASALGLLKFYRNAALQSLLLVLLTSVILLSIIYPPILGWWIGEKNWTDATFSVILIYLASAGFTFKYLILELTRHDHQR